MKDFIGLEALSKVPADALIQMLAHYGTSVSDTVSVKLDILRRYWVALAPTSDGLVHFFQSPTYTGKAEGLRSKRSFHRFVARQDNRRSSDSVKAECEKASFIFGQSEFNTDGTVKVERLALSDDEASRLCERNDFLIVNARSSLAQCAKKNIVLTLEMLEEIAELDRSDAAEYKEIVKDFFPPKAKGGTSDPVDDSAGQVAPKDAKIEDVILDHFRKNTIKIDLALAAVNALNVKDRKTVVSQLTK
jgi:hypothetical protein